jgi:hypothetical protein
LDQRSDELFEKSNARIQLFVRSWEEKKDHLVFKPAPSGKLTSSGQIQWPSTWIGEIIILFGRNIKDVLRDFGTLGATIGQSIIVMVKFVIFFTMPLRI